MASPAPAPSATGPGAMRTVRVWDLPLRLFHWALVICVVGAFVTIKVGGGWMSWHMWFGYAILALLLFRLIWGFIGGRHSRFADFIRSPRRIVAYLKGDGAKLVTLGHNPLGSLSVIAMIALFLAQTVLGLFSNDDIFTEGPLAHLISKDLSDQLTGLHKLNENILLALVGLHLAAIAWYRFGRGKRLVRTMITGNETVPVAEAEAAARDEPPALRAVPVDGPGIRLRGLATFAVCAGFVYWLVTAL